MSITPNHNPNIVAVYTSSKIPTRPIVGWDDMGDPLTITDSGGLVRAEAIPGYEGLSPDVWGSNGYEGTLSSERFEGTLLEVVKQLDMISTSLDLLRDDR